MANWDILKYLRTSNSHVVWLTRQRIKNTAEGGIQFFRNLLGYAELRGLSRLLSHPLFRMISRDMHGIT